MTVRGVAKGSYSRYNQKYNIGFINSDGMEDETQFESVKTLKELSDLFRDFCKENGLKTNTVTYVEAVWLWQRKFRIRDIW